MTCKNGKDSPINKASAPEERLWKGAGAAAAASTNLGCCRPPKIRTTKMWLASGCRTPEVAASFGFASLWLLELIRHYVYKCAINLVVSSLQYRRMPQIRLSKPVWVSGQ